MDGAVGIAHHPGRRNRVETIRRIPVAAGVVTRMAAAARTVADNRSLMFGPRESISRGSCKSTPPTCQPPVTATSQVGGIVYVDANLDGTYTAGEELLNGVPVTLVGTTAGGVSVNLPATTDAEWGLQLRQPRGGHLPSPWRHRPAMCRGTPRREALPERQASTPSRMLPYPRANRRPVTTSEWNCRDRDNHRRTPPG